MSEMEDKELINHIAQFEDHHSIYVCSSMIGIFCFYTPNLGHINFIDWLSNYMYLQGWF